MGCGYYPETSKSVLIVHPDNLEAGKRFGLIRRFKVCAGLRYLGGFIRDEDSKHDWWKNIQRHGERTYPISEELRGNIPSKVTP